MKHHLLPCLLLLIILRTLVIPQAIWAQETDTMGITAFSDTSGIAWTDRISTDSAGTGNTAAFFDSATDSLDQQNYQQSFSWFFSHDQMEPTGWLERMFEHMFHMGFMLSILFVLFVLILPLLLLGGLIYLILKLMRNNNVRQQATDSPQSQEDIKLNLRQQAVRTGSIGVALLLIEFIFGFFHIAGIIGIILICIAAGQWFSNRP